MDNNLCQSHFRHERSRLCKGITSQHLLLQVVRFAEAYLLAILLLLCLPLVSHTLEAATHVWDLLLFCYPHVSNLAPTPWILRRPSRTLSFCYTHLSPTCLPHPHRPGPDFRDFAKGLEGLQKDLHSRNQSHDFGACSGIHVEMKLQILPQMGSVSVQDNIERVLWMEFEAGWGVTQICSSVCFTWNALFHVAWGVTQICSSVSLLLELC